MWKVWLSFHTVVWREYSWSLATKWILGLNEFEIQLSTQHKQDREIIAVCDCAADTCSHNHYTAWLQWFKKPDRSSVDDSLDLIFAMMPTNSALCFLIDTLILWVTFQFEALIIIMSVWVIFSSPHWVLHGDTLSEKPCSGMRTSLLAIGHLCKILIQQSTNRLQQACKLDVIMLMTHIITILPI